jgi:phage terminase Nu1 subunit (DNA packaging protein)
VPDLNRPATVAEEFGNRQMLHLMRLRLLGTFLRMLDAEVAAGNLTPAVREQRRLLAEQFETWYGQAGRTASACRSSCASWSPSS